MGGFIRICCLATGLFFFTNGTAADESYKVVLQISDASISRQTLVLNVAENLQAEFGPSLRLEIVAFGPGLNLMMAGTSQARRLQSLSKKGIKLVACRNTATKMTKLTGKKIKLHPDVDFTGGGAPHIVRLVNQGYVLLRP